MKKTAVLVLLLVSSNLYASSQLRDAQTIGFNCDGSGINLEGQFSRTSNRQDFDVKLTGKDVPARISRNLGYARMHAFQIFTSNSDKFTLNAESDSITDLVILSFDSSTASPEYRIYLQGKGWFPASCKFQNLDEKI